MTVNGKRMDIPSYIVKSGDKIAWKAVGETKPGFIDALTDGIPRRPVPSWLNLDPDALTGQVVGMPEVSEIDTGIDSRMIVEFYSR
tara:strand:- start:209 stop:466 length:258 start_codon:yes stop_codon:yes gene_type:complete